MSQPHLLPGPTADLWDWQLQGACRGENSDVFYHPDGERGRARAQRENRADPTQTSRDRCHESPPARCPNRAMIPDSLPGPCGSGLPMR